VPFGIKPRRCPGLLHFFGGFREQSRAERLDHIKEFDRATLKLLDNAGGLVKFY
jgi:hypothetical protein